MDQLTVVMLKKHGETEDTQFFEYTTGYFEAPKRVEWDKGTMQVDLPAPIAKWLVQHGHARLDDSPPVVTTTEVEVPVVTTTEESPVESPVKKKEKRND
jgi:hypothetical protein